MGDRPEAEGVYLLRKPLEFGGHHQVREIVEDHIHLHAFACLTHQRLQKAPAQSVTFPDERFEHNGVLSLFYLPEHVLVDSIAVGVEGYPVVALLQCDLGIAGARITSPRLGPSPAHGVYCNENSDQQRLDGGGDPYSSKDETSDHSWSMFETASVFKNSLHAFNSNVSHREKAKQETLKPDRLPCGSIPECDPTGATPGKQKQARDGQKQVCIPCVSNVR